jgi:hypothetical protein
MFNQQHAKHECKLWLNGVGLPELRLSSFDMYEQAEEDN